MTFFLLRVFLPKKLSFAQNLLSHCHFLMLYFVFDNFLGFILYLAIFEGSFCFLAIFEGCLLFGNKLTYFGKQFMPQNKCSLL